MAKELFFSGGELELLVAMDRTGCVLTDDGKFYCDLEKDGVPSSRLPVRIRGTYAAENRGWKIRYQVVPEPRTSVIGIVFALLFAASLISFAVTGGSLTGSALFGILNAALIVNYAAQYKGCMKRFENMFGC